jgi:hypothetical protein
MDRVHFCSTGASPLCKISNARWCTIMRDAVTCPVCLDGLSAGERLGAAVRAAPPPSQPLLTPVPWQPSLTPVP